MNLREKKPHDTNTIFIDKMHIKLYITEHFSPLECQVLGCSQEALIQKPLSYYTDNIQALHGDEKRYAILLAVFQRIHFPLEYSLFDKPAVKSIPVEDLPNFILFNELFEGYFQSIYPLKTSDEKFKNRIKIEVYTLVKTLWISGYGLIEDYGIYTIDRNLINSLLQLRPPAYNSSKNRNYISHIRYLANMLNFQVPRQPQKTRMSKTELELNHWNVLVQHTDTEITKSMKSYIFEDLYERTKGTYTLTYTNKEGSIQRVSLNSISMGYWRNSSSKLRTIATILAEQDIKRLQDITKNRILNILLELQKTNSHNVVKSYKSAIRSWLELISLKHNLQINLEKLFSKNIARNDIPYGRVFNFSAAVSLIETLLNDQSPYFNDNDIMQFRMRRILLLQLETGKRISELCILKRDCLQNNKYGDTHVVFHKTKNGKLSTSPLSQEGIKWINQLKAVAPPTPIAIETQFYSWGDDLTEYRLVSSKFDNPLDKESVNLFLKNLQKKIWKSKNPNGQEFTTHDMRRMCATYLKLKGFNDEEIKNRLGQTNLQSQIPYQLTHPYSHVEHFETVYKQGLWEIEDNNTSEEDSTTFSLNEVLHQGSKYIDIDIDENPVLTLFEKVQHIVNTLDLPNDRYIHENDINSGFPIGPHNCNANMNIKCHHTELKCFSCRFYKPDSHKLNDHKAEVLRWILLLNFYKVQKKKTKNGLNLIISSNTSDIESNLKETFATLFQKFSLNNNQAEKIEKELYVLAKKYNKKYGKIIPNPTFEQTLDFIKCGVING
ncbi:MULTISPECIES: tyrosine-type recombinase/integrase [Bacillus cereus group]|uniref:tyrosine-type recombinase/integrase n=1 Tax=Bacillus cereus group TaxID=86661 RepID=UPI0024BD145D|nr:site-specific integrase [Bacillus cereus]